MILSRRPSTTSRPRTVGAIVTALTLALATLLPATTAAATTAGQLSIARFRHVLLFGDNARTAIRDAAGSMKGIKGDLEAEGFHVDLAATLPADLTSYGQVWSLHAYSRLQPSVETRLVEFARSGGSVLLTGENSACCSGVNASDKRIVDQLVALPAGGLVLGPFFDGAGAYPINPFAIRGLATSPHALTGFAPVAPGSIDTAGLKKRNFLSFATPRYATIGVWDSYDLIGTGGRLALVMDINWAEAQYRGPEAASLAVNLATFLKVPFARP